MGKCLWSLIPEGCQSCVQRYPGVLARAFETVEALSLDGVFVKGVVGVREKDLAGVVICEADSASRVLTARGDVEGLVWATDRMDKDGPEEFL